MIDIEKEELASELKGSLLRFTQFFYPLLTSRDFIVSNPHGRESHHVTLCRALTQAARLQIPDQRLMINISPGAGKSTMLAMWVAWCLAQYPFSRFLYISYSKVLAAKHTDTIKRIVQLPHYKYLFNVQIRHDSKAKDSWQTTAGGAVSAFGSSGAITGQDAGLPGLPHFSGAAIMDDMHKPDEVFSDTIRAGVIDNYKDTIQQRMRGINVPIIFIGQRLHEDDLAAYLLSGKDGYKWLPVIIKSIDAAGNAMYPEAQPLSMLKIKQERDPYVFASQYQQDPIPAGGALFKPEWFEILDEEPTMLLTFITADTAETNKSWNDATVFSFFGVYEIEIFGKKTGELGLHWLDCQELRIEPKDLKGAFIEFWQGCMTHPKPPLMAAIEKKSTGVTLVSVLQEMRGLQIRQIERTRASGSKTQRFLEIQPYVASKRVSFTDGARHAKMCLDHMSKITANNSHRHDDVCYVAGSKIATTDGYVNIENITIHHKIITPLGIGNVKACGSMGFKEVIKNIGLEGTPDHPVFTANGFLPLVIDMNMMMLDRLSFLGLLKWKQRQLLYLMEKNLDLRHRQDILKLLKKNTEINFFVVLHGSFIRKQKYLKGFWFTMKTITNLLTVLKILSVFHAKNIVKRCGKDLKNHNKEYAQENTSMKEVFNLTVEPYGVYYVNDILVSNCDTLTDGIKMALIDKTLSYNLKPKDTLSASIMQSQKSALRARSNLYGNQQNN